MDDLSTRTVAQLKALCKERGIKGYTKLTKPDLIQKITAFLAGTKTAPTTSQSPNIAVPTNAASGPPHNDSPESSAASASSSHPPLAREPASTSSSQSAEENIAPVSHPRGSHSASGPSLTALGSVPTNPAKRRRTKSPLRPVAPAKTPVFKAPAIPARSAAPPLPHTYTSASVSAPPTPLNSGWPRLTSSYKPLAPPSSSSTKPLNGHLHAAVSTVTSSSRDAPASNLLKPSRPFKALQPLATARDVVPQLDHTSSSATLDRDSSKNQLDFSMSQLPPLSDLAPRRITMPMSLRLRPVARKWAIFLTRLTDAERSQMILVSKAMRYAVYLSAAHILHIDFQGARLASYLRSVRDPEVMDLWPYLRARQEEAASRHAAYGSSFLPAFYRSHSVLSPISESLWASPDHENQATIAVRFLVAKAWFAASLPNSPDKVNAWLRATVVDAKEISKGAVWTITQQQPTGRLETLYVVYETGEVIGHSASVDVPIRHDWAQHLAALGGERSSLMELVVWHNGEEYERGISKLWLSRIPDGDARRPVAERYVLACVAPNSVSGSYKSVRQIADEFASLGDSTIPGQRKNAAPAQLCLYLPEHHYVESVSFHTTAPARPLHPALAAVQTPGREYIVLRDTGMHVGCEEDGVAEVWMKILGCDARGVDVRA